MFVNAASTRTTLFSAQRKALGVVYGEEETDWFQLEMWNRDAEYAAKVCKKGGRVGVTVSLRPLYALAHGTTGSV